MGACCCCSKKRTTPSNRPGFRYVQRASEERVPLSSHAAAAVSTGLLVDTNLDTSVPDAYRPPPLPSPFDVAAGHPQTPSPGRKIDEIKKDSGAQATQSNSNPETLCGSTKELSKSDVLKKLDSKVETICEVDSSKDTEAELSKAVDPTVLVVVEEDVCPICLEDYDADNPKMIPKCEHPFHLACILEWMERSETCAVCSQIMVIEPPVI